MSNTTSTRNQGHDNAIDSSSVLQGGLLRPTLVRASAGTGKTYQLTARLLKILLQGAAPESILATTFTRKAAGEILHRVLLDLARAADEKDEEALQKLRDQVGIPTLPRSVCLQLLGTLLRNIHRLRICTLDSLFAQLARSFPFELGLPPAWRLTDEIEESWLQERAVDSLIAMLDPAEMTTVLSMLGKGDVKRSIARELLQVIDAAYGNQRQCEGDVWDKLTVPTAPESAELTRAAGYLRQAEPPQKSLRAKLERVAEALETRELSSLIQDTLINNIATARRQKTDVRFGRSKFPDGIDPAFDVVYAAVQSFALAQLRAQNQATGTILAAYDHHITQLKQSARALGFDDVAIRLAKQFATLDQQSLGNRMDGAIDHVLLDEFQDTSPVQWQVLRPLASRTVFDDDAAELVDEQRRVERSFFCVGDTKQAIYGWRGGVAEIFDAVADQIPGISEVEQNDSFRTSQVVLDVVNETFGNIARHPMASEADSGDLTSKSMHEAAAIHHFAKRFPPHRSMKGDLAGHVRIETSRRVQDGDAEACREALFEDTARLIHDLNQRAPEKSIGVLTRTNRGVGAMIDELERLGVDVSQEGGNPLTDSAPVEIVLSALMMSEHPGDRRWEFHVMNSPLAEIENFGPSFVRQLIEDRGLSEAVESLAGALAPVCDPRDTLRLKQLSRMAIAYQPTAGPRLRDFVRMVREKRVERPRVATVRVMTVHQAKGLEFDAVVLPELDAALTRPDTSGVGITEQLGEPSVAMTRYMNHESWHFLSQRWQRAFGDQVAGSVTEALCLLYVAMTRPRQALHIVIQPTKKQDFAVRSASSLIYHALRCDGDPTQPTTTLYEVGDPNWFLGKNQSENSDIKKPAPRRGINFQPLPPVPRRNRKPDV